MEYKENTLSYENYCSLRTSVGWTNFSMTQTQTALANSLYTVIAVENNETIAMGRLIGDGQYYMIVDVIVHPDLPINQRKGISYMRIRPYIPSKDYEYVSKMPLHFF